MTYEELLDENARLRSCLSDDVENAKLILDEVRELRDLANNLQGMFDERYCMGKDLAFCDFECPYRTGVGACEMTKAMDVLEKYGLDVIMDVLERYEDGPEHMRIASFYPYACEWLSLTYDWHNVVAEARVGVSISTTQMAALDLVKHYDEIRICDRNGDSVVQIHNNHDGTYDCPQTERTLRFANRFYNLWANNEFGDQPQRLPFQDWRMHNES